MKYRTNRSWYDVAVRSNDGRRHRARCCYSTYCGKKYFCSIKGDKCTGATFCCDYSEAELKPVRLPTKTEPRNTLARDLILIKNGSMVKHKYFGFGTVADTDLDTITVDFFKDGVKKRVTLSYYACIENKLLSLYDYK